MSRTPENDRAIKNAGFTDVEGFYNANEQNGRYVLATTTSGQQQLMDMDAMYGMTGYTAHMTDKQLAQMEREARIAQMSRGGTFSQAEQKEKLIQDIMTGEKISYAEAFDRATTMMSTSSDVRGIQSVLDDNPEMSYDEAAERWYSIKRSGVNEGVMSNEERYVQDYLARNPSATRGEATSAYKNLGLTSDQKEVSAVQSAKARIDELNFGTEEEPINFFEVNFSSLNPGQRAQIQKNIAEIEKLDPNSQLSTEDKRVARDIRNLIQLGGTAGSEITDKETGLIDRSLNTLKSYFINDVGGTEGTAAYESFRNIFRNALYGASLTPTEVAAFNKAMGTLGQKTLPVLNRLQTQMESLKNQLESIRDLGDPYVMHYYLGGDVEQVDDIIRALDERIGGVKAAVKEHSSDAKPLVNKPAPVQDGTKTKSLDAIWDEQMSNVEAY